MNKSIVKLLICSVFCLGSVQQTLAQAVNSPYTFGSLGLLESPGFVHQQMMGGLTTVTRDKGDYSLVNPATLHALEQTSLQTGSAIGFIEQKQGDSLNRNFNGDFGYFSMGIPLSLKRKMAFGFQINRLTDVDYLLNGQSIEDSIPVTNLFAGHGGINQFKMGFGAQLFEGFSVGVGAALMFGNIENQLDKQFPENNEIFSLRNISTTYYNGVKWNLGVQYTRQIKGKTNITVGLHGSPGSTLNTSSSEILRTYNFDGNFFVDTISNREEATSTQKLPAEFGGGLSMGKDNRWMFGVQYNVAKWSEIEKLRNSNPFFDQTSFTIGGYLQLKERMSSQRTNKTQRINDYLKTIRIYYGLKMQSLYTGVINEQVSETAISLGLGIPLNRVYSIEGVKYRMVSRVNIGAEYLVRGKTDNGMVQENILGIKVGLNFNDKWFNKRKYQ